MKATKNNNRTLAYQKAREISLPELDKVGGGASENANRFTTKQTFSTSGSLDVGVDVQW